MTDKYKRYSQARKKAQLDGTLPEWYSTAGYQLVVDKYYIDRDETVKQRYLSIAETLSNHLPIEYRHTYYNKFYNLLWEGFLSPATPVFTNVGKPSKGMPISCSGTYVYDSVDGFYTAAHEIAMMSKNGFGTSAYLGDIRPRGVSATSDIKADGVVPVLDLMYKTAKHISQGSCYHPDVEVLTEKGFKSFSDARELNLKVLQVGEDGSNDFVYPEEWVEQDYEGDLVHFKDSKNIDIKVTPNHRMFFKYRRRLDNTKVNGKYKSQVRKVDSNFTIKSAEECPIHRDVIFCNSIYSNSESEGLSWYERLLIAFQADGTIIRSNSSSSNHPIAMGFHFLKQRKIDRLKLILSNLDIDYTERTQSDGSTNFYVKFACDMKTLSWIDLTSLSKNKAIEILREVANWDGSGYKLDGRDRFFFTYSSICKVNADVLQSVASLAGVKSRCTFSTRDNEPNKSPIYQVTFSQGDEFGGENVSKYSEYYSGKVYCAIVPKGGLIVRSNGHTLVCGNTRRGSVACYLPVSHDDFWEVCHYLENNSSGANFGWCFTDEDIAKLETKDEEATKRYQEILYLRMLGIGYIFLSDNANRQNPEVYNRLGLKVNAPQLCNEIMLYNDKEHSYTCCLSSLNLVHWDRMKADHSIIFDSIVFLDCVNSEFIKQSEGKPGLQRARNFALGTRPIGLGVMGYSTYLQANSIVFDSLQGYLKNKEIFKTIRKVANEANKWLGEKLGEPELMKGTGLRCSHLLAVAPTLSTAIVMGGVSNGIEPFYANVYTAETSAGEIKRANPELVKLLKSKGFWTKAIIESIANNSGSVQHLGSHILTDHEKAVFRTAFEVDQVEIIRQAEARQEDIDQGQSLNIFESDKAEEELISYHHKLIMTSKVLKGAYYVRSTAGVNGRTTLSEQKSACSSCEG